MIEGILIILVLLLAWSYTTKWSTFAAVSIIGVLGVAYVAPKLHLEGL